MSKPLSSYPKEQRREVAQRRVAQSSGGLGYLSAIDYLNKTGTPIKKIN